MIEFSLQSMRRIEDSVFESFETRAVDFIEENFPQFSEISGRESLYLFVRNSHQRSYMTGIKTELNLVRLMLLQIMYGWELQDVPRAADIEAILYNDAKDETERLDAIFDILAVNADA